MKKESLEQICFNCSYFLSASIEEATEDGICLKDEAFEPFTKQLLKHANYSACQALIDRKKFSGEQEACDHFEKTQMI
ncbi:MAG: hypothetical protein JSW39_22520 [Desulfobacterales bacterium]|nr:MAG: hypothetical protein JSW39_22520 [Desulfobacterales bacterium]